MRLLYLTLFVVYLQSAFGATHNLTLRFQPNTLQLVDSNTLPIVSIADTNTVHPFLGKFSLNDSLVLKVINADTLSHNFTIENYSIVTCRLDCAGSLKNKGLRLEAQPSQD